MSATDPFDLARFVEAQAPVLDAVLAELAAGRKTTHWMWFVFPQLGALGRSTTARYYGIGSLDEARAYWQHPALARGWPIARVGCSLCITVRCTRSSGRPTT